MMADWDRRFPGRTESVFSALQNVVPSHLADYSLFDFKGLTVGKALPEMDGGDTVFDESPLDPGHAQVGIVLQADRSL